MNPALPHIFLCNRQLRRCVEKFAIFLFGRERFFHAVKVDNLLHIRPIYSSFFFASIIFRNFLFSSLSLAYRSLLLQRKHILFAFNSLSIISPLSRRVRAHFPLVQGQKKVPSATDSTPTGTTERGMPRLFHHALLQIFGQVGAHNARDMIGGHLLHIVRHHDADQLLERGALGIPSQLSARLRGVAP